MCQAEVWFHSPRSAKSSQKQYKDQGHFKTKRLDYSFTKRVTGIIIEVMQNTFLGTIIHCRMNNKLKVNGKILLSFCGLSTRSAQGTVTFTILTRLFVANCERVYKPEAHPSSSLESIRIG